MIFLLWVLLALVVCVMVVCFLSSTIRNKERKSIRISPRSLIKSNLRLVDTFIVNSELDVLEFRLNEHDDFVSKFIAVESNMTHTGQEKPTFVKDNWERFAPWHNKLELITLDDLHDPQVQDMKPRMRERHARNVALARVKELVKQGDIGDDEFVSVVADCDEVYDRESLAAILRKDTIFRPQWQFYYYNLNCLNSKLIWPQNQRRTFILSPNLLSQIKTFGWDAVEPNLKSKNTGVVGWHLSNFGGAELIKNKYDSVFESGVVRVVKNVEGAIANCEDVLGRKGQDWVKGEPWKHPRSVSNRFKSKKSLDYWKQFLYAAPSSTTERRLAFYINQLGERGTVVSLFDYMDCSERLLGFKKPIILWLKNKHDNVPAVIEKFKTRFGEENMFPILKWTDVDPILVDQNITELYIQKFGTKDIRVSKVPHIPTYVHSVMTAHEPHGDVYARIGRMKTDPSHPPVPLVPYMVKQRSLSGPTLRDKLHIPHTATVFGRIGGFDQFDIRYAKKVVEEVVQNHPNIYFLLVNTRRFCDAYPNLIHLDKIINEDEKSTFIRTCDAMIHARVVGETFGLAIAEFSVMNKPILTQSTPRVRDRFHLDTLGNLGLYYNDESSLKRQILEFDKIEASKADWNAYRAFLPEAVMQTFRDTFLESGASRDKRGKRVKT